MRATLSTKICPPPPPITSCNTFRIQISTVTSRGLDDRIFRLKINKRNMQETACSRLVELPVSVPKKTGSRWQGHLKTSTSHCYVTTDTVPRREYWVLPPSNLRTSQVGALSPRNRCEGKEKTVRFREIFWGLKKPSWESRVSAFSEKG